MCGVFGVSNAALELPVDQVQHFTKALLLASESRGSEAAGVAAWSNHGVEIRKTEASPHQFIRQSGFREVLGGLDPPDTAMVIGHARMVTNGSAIYGENNQPITVGGVTLVHNGIVTNFTDLDDSSDGGQSDTAAVARCLSSKRSLGFDAERATHNLFSSLNGSATVAIIDLDSDCLILATNTGSLYVAYLPDGRPAAFTSERRIMERALRTSVGRKLPRLEIEGVAPGTGLTIERMTGKSRPFETGAYSVRDDGHFTGITLVGSADPPVRAKFEDPPRALEESTARTREFSKTVRRCSRCILPETVPFITFDADGVCNQCSSYVHTNVRPVEELDRRLGPFRSSRGPDCIVAFSGGRDSSYGLHLLVEELGMRPITLTYDWGMVTDLARRNQARMTGALGIENVLVSADIARKRRNIGNNLRAWMNHPDLGMVPLLMAGDKQFFLHARRLSRDMGLPLVIFCINPMEMTFFKSGFAGVANQGYYTSSTWVTKARLMGYYARQYLKNPRYLNRSLGDTMQATHATYFRSHDYLQLFEWVDWEEDWINRLLTDQYGWETDPTTTTTWRIGDGTAPFYNYVYWRTVGFTENDTFRSNQVREGKLTRRRALELVLCENEPRWQRIEEYLALVDVEVEEAMTAVERLAGRSPVGR